MQVSDCLDRVNKLVETGKLSAFEYCQLEKKIENNHDRYICWKTKNLQSVDEVFRFESLTERKFMPVYLKQMNSDPVYITTQSIITNFKDTNSHFQFNLLHTGFHPELKHPEVVENVDDNLWNDFPKDGCCPDSYNQACYQNSLIMTSAGFITLPHNDEDTPGSTVVSVHEGRKIWIFLDKDFSEKDVSVERFFEIIEKDLCSAFIVDSREGNMISFPIMSQHMVITLENTVASFWTYFRENDKTKFQTIPNFSPEHKPHFCQKDMKSSVSDEYALFFDFKVISTVQNLQKKYLKFKESNRFSHTFTFNDVLLDIWTLLSMNEELKGVSKVQLFTDEISKLLVGLDPKKFKLSFYICMIINDIVLHKLNLGQEDSAGTGKEIALRLGFGRSKAIEGLLAFFSSSHLIPVLTNLPEYSTDSKYDAIWARESNIQLSFIIVRYLTNRYILTSERFNDFTSIIDAINTSQEIILKAGISMPEKLVIPRKYANLERDFTMDSEGFEIITGECKSNFDNFVLSLLKK